MNVSVGSPPHPVLVAVAGNPNSGKTTLFNRLTGMRQKTANYPGVTVEKKLGRAHLGEGVEIALLDLPGTYALSPRSEEERVAAEVVLGVRPDVPELHGVLCVADASALEKSLPLALQVRQAGVRFALVLTMTDEMAARGGKIDAVKLSRKLGAPVVLVSSVTGEGLEALRELLRSWARLPPSPRPGRKPAPPSFREVLRLREQAALLAASSLARRPGRHVLTERIDAVLMHPVVGPLAFLAVMVTVFQSVFTWAVPLMDVVEAGVVRLGGMLSGILPAGLLRSFVVDGLVAGVGSVVVFLPQILILFLFIGFLEQSGYLARAAVVMDRFMRSMGLQGRSFLPLLSSYACAVPGILATRTIENRKDRLATIFVVPFMTCSARLPVYTLLIAAFVPDRPLFGPLLGLRAAVMIGLYALGLAAAVGTAWLLKSSILKADKTPFLMEIPPYRMPSLRTVALLLGDRALVFLRRAGTVILAVTVALWFLASFPRTESGNQIRESYAGALGRLVEPVIKPLGFDWKVGVGLVTSLAAREVIVATLATLYQVEEGEAGIEEGLRETLRRDWTPLSAIALMVFFVFALQCMSTVAVVRRETGGWKWPAAQFAYMLFLAYSASFLVVQVGRFLGFDG